MRTLFLLVLVLALLGCAPPPIPPGSDPFTNGNAAAQAQCVDEAGADAASIAGVKHAIDECRCAVRARYGNPCDGGAQ